MKASEVGNRLWRSVNKTETCWLWTGAKDRKGYGRIRIGGRTGGRVTSVHRLSYEWAFGPIQSGLCVCHHCDTPSCVRPPHLFLGTIADNNADMVQKGRNGRTGFHGESNPRAKLTEVIVLSLRNRHANGEKIASLARELGIPYQTAWNAASTKSTKWAVTR